jgi:hypothetical protein
MSHKNNLYWFPYQICLSFIKTKNFGIKLTSKSNILLCILLRYLKRSFFFYDKGVLIGVYELSFPFVVERIFLFCKSFEIVFVSNLLLLNSCITSSWFVRKIIKLFAYLCCKSIFYFLLLHFLTPKFNSSPSGLKIWWPQHKYQTKISSSSSFVFGKHQLRLFVFIIFNANFCVRWIFVCFILVCMFAFKKKVKRKKK